MMKKIWNTVRRTVPIWSAVLFVLFIGALIMNQVIHKSGAVANAIHDTVGVGIRTVMTTLPRGYQSPLRNFC